LPTEFDGNEFAAVHLLSIHLYSIQPRDSFMTNPRKSMRCLKFASKSSLPVAAMLACGAFAMTLPAAVLAQLPVARLYSVFPPGAKVATTVDVTISGDDLEKASALHLSHPGITAVQKTQAPALGETGPQPTPNQFTVTVAPEVQPGLYEVRASGKYGVSNPRAFVVGARNELIEKEPNNASGQATEVPLGSLMNGQSNGANDQDYFSFTAKAGQRVIIDCQAYRIDSRMDASLVLYDASGKELDRSRDVNRRDPLIDFTAPADGTYFVEVHDFLYAGNGEHFYRLSIGSEPYIDFVYPPAGVPGSNETYTLYGRNLPGGQPSDVKGVDGKPLETLQVQIAVPAGESTQQLDNQSLVEPDEGAIDGFAYHLESPSGPSNSVLMGYASAPVVLEKEPNNEPAQAQVITPGSEIAGRFHPQGDRDWVTFEAKAGQVLWMEVFSQRLGLPTDASLLVQQVTKNEKGEEQVKEIAAVDDYLDNPQGQTRRGMALFDMKTDDPAYRFVAPADGTYRVLVRNQANYTAVDPRLGYRLAIRAEQPDFRVIAKPRLLPFSADPLQNPPTVWNPLLRKGGTEILDVVVFRRDGFNGPVEVSVEGLPAGVTAKPITVAPGQEVGELVLVAAEDAPAGMGLINVVGKARIGEQDVAHPARYASMVWGGAANTVTPRTRIARNLAVGVSGGETAPYFIDAGQNVVLEMCKAGTVQVPVKLTRRGDFKGAVTMSPFPLPPGVKPPVLTLDDKTAEGKLDMALAANTPPGAYTFTLTATSPVSYARNPEAVAEATARKGAVDKIAGELAAAAKTTADAKAAAEKAAADMTAAMEQARLANEAAAKELAAAQAKVEAAKVAMATAEAQMKAAAEAKAAAEKAAADADAQAKSAAEVQKAVDKQVADATAAAAPKNVNVSVPSTVVTLKVTEAPVTLEVTPPAAGKPGTTLEVPLKIARLYGFADVVAVAVKPVGEAPGLKTADVSLPAAQADGKLAVEIAADTKPGTAKFNGQDLSVTKTVPVVVEAAAAQ
jgi:hypothetical protein